MLHQSRLPSSYWCYAFSIATYLVNRVPSSVLQFKSPWEKLFHTPPSLQSLKTFGCACFLLLRPYFDHKLQSRSTQCLFLGYPPLTKGYICLEPQTHKFYITFHVIFHGIDFPVLPTPFASSNNSGTASPFFDLWLSTPLPTSSSDPLSAVSVVFPSLTTSIYVSNESSDAISFPSPSPTSSSSATSDPIPQSSLPIGQSMPPSIPNTHPMLTRSKHGSFKPKAYTVVRDYSQVEPTSFSVASLHPQWIEAMDSEYASLLKQHNFLVPIPAGKNVVSCKWVYKTKRDSDGAIARYKVRLVAKGFLQ